MVTTLETNDQFAGDGFGKGLPVGIKLFDTDGKVVPRISAVKPTSPVKGDMVYGITADKIEVYNGTAWKGTTLT